MVRVVAVADAGQLLVSGVLDGTATRRGGAKTRVRGQPFTAPAVPVDDVRTTDVVLLKMAPMPSPRWGGRSHSPRCPSTSRPSPTMAACSRRPRPRGWDMGATVAR
jgi:hypothetical protein